MVNMADTFLDMAANSTIPILSGTHMYSHIVTNFYLHFSMDATDQTTPVILSF